MKLLLLLLKALLITLVWFFVLKSCQERSEVKRVQRYIERLPEILNVEKLIYIAESPWYYAIGPGGNEGGVRVFEMPEEIVNKLATDRDNFLKNEAFKTNRVWAPLIHLWHESPDGSHRFPPNGIDREDCTANQFSTIQNYIEYYTSVDLNHEIIDTIDNALQSEGSFSIGYYGSLLILMPKERWIVYAFNG